MQSARSLSQRNKSCNISKTTTTNQCRRVPDLWRPGSVKVKRYYTKNGRLIPTAKRGKEIKKTVKLTQVQYIRRYFGLKNKPSTRAHFLLGPVEGLFFKPKYRANILYLCLFHGCFISFPLFAVGISLPFCSAHAQKNWTFEARPLGTRMSHFAPKMFFVFCFLT